MCAIRQRTIFEDDRARRSIVDHKEIVAALEARDTERAERLVREHTLKLRSRRALADIDSAGAACRLINTIETPRNG